VHNAIYELERILAYFLHSILEVFMFSNSSSQQGRALAKLVMNDGKALIVSVKLSITGKLMEAFGGTDMFVDAIAGDGTQMLLNKSTIARVEAADPPKAGLNQNRRQSDSAGFNPYAILGVDKAATPEIIREAYVRQVKQYHPDRFGALDLPQEMKDYAAAMLTRINMAYQQLGG
jgi:hypothetical protein